MSAKSVWETWGSGEMRPGGRALTLRMLESAGLAPGARVADVGCGAGAGVAFLIEKGYDAVGVDISARLIEAARARHGDAFYRADAAALPFVNGALDGLLFECSLSEVADAGAVLRECARVLKAGGALMVSDVYDRSADDALSWEARLREAGFSPAVWEDRSEALEEFIGRALWELDDPAALKGMCKCAAGSAGYFIAVARRDGEGG